MVSPISLSLAQHRSFYLKNARFVEEAHPTEITWRKVRESFVTVS